MIGSGGVYTAVFAWREERLLETLEPSEVLAWALLVGLSWTDILLTVLGIQQGLVELNPIARIAIDAGGVGALIPLKMLALGIAGLGWSCLPTRQRRVVLVALLVPTIGVVTHNAHLLVG